jgi:hypothetical protein
MEDGQFKTVKMSEMRKTFGLCDSACEGFDSFTAAYARRKTGCYLHGLFREERIDELACLRVMIDKRAPHLGVHVQLRPACHNRIGKSTPKPFIENSSNN